MKAFKLWSSAAMVAIAVGLFSASTPARADSYQIYDLTSGHQTNLVGITTSGTAVLFTIEQGVCGISSAGCYYTWVNGVMVNHSGTAPNFVYDNGTKCVPNAPPGFGSGLIAACNNGREVYGTGMYPPYAGQMFTGPDPVADHFSDQLLGEVRLNSSGDFLYLAGNLALGDGEVFEAINLTAAPVPEPASILLLGTGLLAGLGGLRRRLF